MSIFSYLSIMRLSLIVLHTSQKFQEHLNLVHSDGCLVSYDSYTSDPDQLCLSTWFILLRNLLTEFTPPFGLFHFEILL